MRIRSKELHCTTSGHKDIKTTLTHYAHTNKQAEREAKERIHAQWLRAAAPKEIDDYIAPIKEVEF